MAEKFIVKQCLAIRRSAGHRVKAPIDLQRFLSLQILGRHQKAVATARDILTSKAHLSVSLPARLANVLRICIGKHVP